MQETQLQTSKLGATGLEITRIGLGAWAIGGGGWEFGWGSQDDEESVAAIQRAVDLGVNWIDTAPAYGFGRSETVVGRAIAGMTHRPYVFTKCSLVEGSGRRVEHSLEPDSILREAEASLERLGVDAIDLYQIHWPIPERTSSRAGPLWRSSRSRASSDTSASRTSTSRSFVASSSSRLSRRSSRSTRSSRARPRARSCRSPNARGSA
ncbi:MAG: hypothetical protein QOD81_2960 [Solirubrobacteraceae bacterium]|nr:hypothetical protein [Solirubrobacteraceae bacterium]